MQTVIVQSLVHRSMHLKVCICRPILRLHPESRSPTCSPAQVPRHRYRVVGDAGSKKVEIDVSLSGEYTFEAHRGGMHCASAWHTDS
jgi:hypothetical protein